MDQGGVQQICLSAWYRPSGPVVSNADVAEFTRAYPDRIFGIAGIDLNDPTGYVQEIEHFVGQENFKGVRVVPWLWNLAPTSREYWPLFVKCCELDIPFLTQVGHTGPLCPSEVGRPVPYIDEVALKFPKLKIICGHIGFPWTQEMIGVAWKHENVFIDTSAYLPKYYPPVSAREHRALRRCSCLLVGTDTIRQHDWEEESNVRNQFPAADVESMRRFRPQAFETSRGGEG